MTGLRRWLPLALIVFALVGLLWVALTTHDRERLIICACMALMAGAMVVVLLDWARR